MKSKNILEGKFKINKIVYPNNTTHLDTNEWAVLACSLVDSYSNHFQKNRFGNYSLTGNVGCEIDLSDGLEYVISVAESENKKYGMSYNIEQMHTDYQIEDKEGMLAFLSHVVTANQLKSLEQLEDLVDVINNKDVARLCTLKGIQEKTAVKILEKVDSNSDYGLLYAKFPNINFTPGLVKQLKSVYIGEDAIIEMLETNPYDLIENVKGYGWHRVDDIAKSIGIAQSSPFRIKAFIKYFLRERGETGFSYVTTEDLLANVSESLGDIDGDVFKNVMQELYSDEVIGWSDDKSRVYLMYYYSLEQEIASELIRLIESPKSYDAPTGKELGEAIREVEVEQGWSFTEDQKRAILMGVNSNVCVITGLSGSGKSSSVYAVLKALDKLSYAQTALSGKASSRLQEITGEEGKTIHRLLEYNPQEGGFMRNEDNPLDEEMIIVDEVSMIGGSIFLNLIKSIRSGHKLILLGDVGQLESIGSLNVFKDILEADVVPSVTLNKVHRQAQKSAIIMDGIKVRRGSQITKKGELGQETRGELQDFKLDLYEDKELTPHRVLENYKELYNQGETVRDITVVVPTKTRGEASALSLNIDIQDFLHEGQTPKKVCKINRIENGQKIRFNINIGDRVILKKNLYRVYPNVFNGFLGTVMDIVRDDNGKQCLVVNFDLVGTVTIPHYAIPHIYLGYAITGHSMQGSETKNIIVAMDYSGYVLLSREWLYTAITRAKEYCVLCAEEKALRYAISESKVPDKQTFLAEFLQEMGIVYEKDA